MFFVIAEVPPKWQPARQAGSPLAAAGEGPGEGGGESEPPLRRHPTPSEPRETHGWAALNVVAVKFFPVAQPDFYCLLMSQNVSKSHTYNPAVLVGS